MSEPAPLPLPESGPAELLVHIGMGKTGTSSIQDALLNNARALKRADQRYLGMWMDKLEPHFDGFAGFQKFLQMGRAAQPDAARRFAKYLQEQARRDGLRRFIISNEQYASSFGHIHPFFEALRALMPLRLVAYVRHPAEWLPSACMQWAIMHKTFKGPVPDSGTAARRLIGQYRSLLDWTDSFAQQMTLRPTGAGFDVTPDFLRLIGVDLATPPTFANSRRPKGELMLRAAYADCFIGYVRPREYDATTLGRPHPNQPASLRTRFDYLFGAAAMRQVLDNESDLVARIEQTCGLPPAPPPSDPDYDFQTTTEDMIGRLVEISARQATAIEDLRGRLAAIEAAQSQPAPTAASARPSPLARLFGIRR